MRRPLAALLLALTAPLALAGTDELARGAREHVLEKAAAAGFADAAVVLKVIGDTPADCPGPVAVEPVDTRFLTRMKFAATCDAAGWRDEFIVRGELSARVVVATERIAAGRPIASGEVDLGQRTLGSLENATSALDEVVGQSSRRAVRPGQIVDPRWLAEPVLVRRGANVAIIATNGLVRVTTIGEALGAGREGDIIDVRNVASGRVIRARVTANETVEPADIPGASLPQSGR